ncbi:hypothetical protein D9M69_675170 [compost metagenome]
MGREWIEGRVGNDTDFRHFLLDSPHGAIDQIVGACNESTVFGLHFSLFTREGRNGRNAKLRSLLGHAHSHIDRIALDAWHRIHGFADACSIGKEEWQDKIVHR